MEKHGSVAKGQLYMRGLEAISHSHAVEDAVAFTSMDIWRFYSPSRGLLVIKEEKKESQLGYC